MGALLFGLFSLLTFFVPLLCPALALVTGVYGVMALRRKRRRVLTAVGVACAAAAVGLHVWVWRFGHLP